MRFQDAVGRGNHGRSFSLICKKEPCRCGNLVAGLHPDGSTRFAELGREGFKVAGVWTDQHGCTSLERFDHVLASLVLGAGKAFADEDNGCSGIPRGEFSGGIQKQGITRWTSTFRAKATGKAESSQGVTNVMASFDMAWCDDKPQAGFFIPENAVSLGDFLLLSRMSAGSEEG